MQKVECINIRKKLAQFKEYWSPKVIGELNGQVVQVVKLKGDFVWHSHKDSDELFLVVKGRLVVHFRGWDVHLSAGEMLVVPRGVEHKPEAKREVHIILIDPKGTVNTGDVVAEHTVRNPKRI